MYIPDTVLELMDRLEDRGFECYCVGGCVRDHLMGTRPHDYDCCTAAAPEEMQAIFADRQLVLAGLKHGTVGVVTDGGVETIKELCRRGYLVDASRYLVKPLDKEELKEALIHCCEKQAKKEILLPTDKGLHRTSFADIQFVEAFERGTRFVLTGDTVETKLKFSEVEAMLPKSSFILCHRAYIVNLALTKHIGQYEFTMKHGATVPISRLRYNEVNQQFVDFVTD